MSCFRPIPAGRSRSGVLTVGYAREDAYPLELPCGRCIGCKLDRARAWSIRISHEAQLYDSNVFATLTYNDDELPKSLSLEYRDFQLFVKRLREQVVGVSPDAEGRRPLRYFVSGEYGGRTKRPHWHCVLFNVRFPDPEPRYDGNYRSDLCEAIWGKGEVVCGGVTQQSAAYVAGYTLKKAYGEAARDHYEDVVDLRTGEVFSRRPEFVRMSLKPGIGAGWYAKFRRDLFPVDHAVVEGKCWKVPRYYWLKFQWDGDPNVVEEVAWQRELLAMEQPPEESSPERRAVREELALRRSVQFGGRGL